jgi:hypothetical protein
MINLISQIKKKSTVRAFEHDFRDFKDGQDAVLNDETRGALRTSERPGHALVFEHDFKDFHDSQDSVLNLNSSVGLVRVSAAVSGENCLNHDS